METIANLVNHKNKFHKAGILVLLFLSVFSSCVKDTTTQPSTTQGPPDARAPFEGSWICSENTNSVNSKFTVTITNDASNSTNIIIGNFNNLGSKYLASAIVNDQNITLQKQSINNDSYEGSGQLSSGKIILNYKKTDVNQVVTIIQAVCTKNP
jgi:hypothetical protein